MPVEILFFTLNTNKDMKIKNLPVGLRELALKQQELQGNVRNADLRVDDDKVDGNFDWDETDQDQEFWWAVYCEKYTTAKEIYNWESDKTLYTDEEVKESAEFIEKLNNTVYVGGVDPVPVEQGGEEKDFDDEKSEKTLVERLSEVFGDTCDMKEEKSEFAKIAEQVAGLLEYKNAKYGNSALNPINVFNGKSKVGQRADDKISRIQNSDVLKKNDIVDLLGYLILMCQENNWTTFDEFKD